MVGSVLVAVLLAVTGCSAGGTTGGSAAGGSRHLSGAGGAGHGAAPGAEEARAGTAGWRIAEGAVASDVQLSAFADQTSVRPGESVRVFASTDAAQVRVRALRMGWYAGLEAREVWSSARLAGRRQGGRLLDRGTGAVYVDWQPTVSVSTSGWPEGFYLLRLDTSAGRSRYIPLVVRSADARGRVALMAEVNTYQAYNTWGGRDLYAGEDGKRGSRSSAVSFDRPYDGNGAVKYFAFEDPLVHRAARLNLPLAYTTDVQLDHDPALLNGALGLVSLGHDEYWTPAMRAHATTARDAGSNLAFLGANAIYWRVRYAPTALGKDRLMIGYKSLSDPIAGKEPASTTVRFRDPPAADPENGLVGQLYECFPASGAYVVQDPGFFLFRGTGARAGMSFPGLVGIESDRAYPLASTPRPLQVVARGPMRCGRTTSTHTSVYYTVPSGAGVFSIGTLGWVLALRGPRPSRGVDQAGSDFVRTVTDNLLREMAAGPMGRRHPAVDNLAEQHLGTRNSTGSA